jgi:hypothetical protein
MCNPANNKAVSDAQSPNCVVLLDESKISKVIIQLTGLDDKIPVLEWDTSIPFLECPPHNFFLKVFQTPWSTRRNGLFTLLLCSQMIELPLPFSDLDRLYIVGTSN